MQVRWWRVNGVLKRFSAVENAASEIHEEMQGKTFVRTLLNGNGLPYRMAGRRWKLPTVRWLSQSKEKRPMADETDAAVQALAGRLENLCHRLGAEEISVDVLLGAQVALQVLAEHRGADPAKMVTDLEQRLMPPPEGEG